MSDRVAKLWDKPKDMLRAWDDSFLKGYLEGVVALQVGRVDSVADLGCGCGRLVNVLPEFKQYYGFDSSIAMLDEANRRFGNRSDVSFTNVDIFGYSSDREYDVAVMLDVAQHQERPLDSIIRMLQLWEARCYVFTLLIGDRREELLMSKVVALSEFLGLWDKMVIADAHIEKYGKNPFAWASVVSTGLQQ